MDRNATPKSLGLRAGESVEVRSAEEILATLDENGMLDGMPFMPEMLEYCGKTVRVWKRADKTCDTIERTGGRRIYDSVHLDGLRCNGAAHGGCEARCLLFWKEAWLKRSGPGAHQPPAGSPAPGGDAEPHCDRQGLLDASYDRSHPEDTEPRYRCQATELRRFSSPLHWWDLRQYVRDVGCGNVGIMQVVRAALFRVFCLMLRVGGYRVLHGLYSRLQTWRGGTPYPYFKGKLKKTPRETLDLQPGERVQVKSYDEILQTLNGRNTNLGLSFDPEMVRYCGTVHRVLARVDRIVDERNGKMLKFSRDCLILDNVYCQAEYSDRRLFCPRAIYPYWREIWLKRLDDNSPAAVTGGQKPVREPSTVGDRG